MIGGAHDLIDDIAVVCKEQKSLGILVKPSHRVNSERVIQIINDSDFISLLLRAADNAPRFMKQKNNLLLFFCNRLSVYADFLCAADPLSYLYGAAVYCDAAGFNQPVCLPPGADACIT